MANLPGQPVAEATTINRVSAMTLIIPVKQGLTAPLVLGPPPHYDHDAAPVRWVDNLRSVMLAIQAYANSGQVTALNQVATIHYARWVIINNGQDMLFTANYDTSLDQYLSDFMTIANVHGEGHVPWMDLLWGNLVDYPGGEVTHFIEWARSWQVDTTLFFPTVSDLTVRDLAWLRKFRHEFDAFDADTQGMDWPEDLAARYQALKRAMNNIDVSLVG